MAGSIPAVCIFFFDIFLMPKAIWMHAIDSATCQLQFSLIFFVEDVGVQKLHAMAYESFERIIIFF